MVRHYPLDTKIHAMNLLETYDDLVTVSQELNIPAVVLNTWRKEEADLRQNYQQKLQRQFVRLKAELQVEMLERGMKVVACMDDETLENAPLNQLATTLSALVNQALKLDEASEETDQQTEEKVIRFEFISDGRVTETPPWTVDSSEESSPIQDSSMRETLGQNGTRKNHTNGRGEISRDAWMVAGTDLSDVESGLAGFEADFEEYDWYHD